jgi:hypothetical protein
MLWLKGVGPLADRVIAVAEVCPNACFLSSPYGFWIAGSLDYMCAVYDLEGSKICFGATVARCHANVMLQDGKQ